MLLVFGLLTGALITGTRFVAHIIFMRGIRGWSTRRSGRKVLIVGAGSGGHLLEGELRKNPELGYRPIGYVDDNKKGADILGTTFDLDEVLEDVEPDEVMIAIPSASGELRGRVVIACRERGVPVRTVPTVFELLQGGNHLTRQLREVRVEDVLGRNPVRMEIESVGGYLTGRRVLVTGAGGSIGSEICRQIARVNPSRLVLLDHSEANLFEIEREMVDERHVQTSVSVLADVKDEERMREVFAQHEPEIVFHAAAYKHVGLMEANPIEAVRNNALATRTLTNIAGEAGTLSFVLISTDKAVAPATVMGASKALAEWAVESANARFARHGLLRRALRQRARLLRLGGADLPAPDRRGRPGHGDRPGDDALLHDHPGGRPARHPVGLARQRRRGLRAGHGRAGLDHGAGASR